MMERHQVLDTGEGEARSAAADSGAPPAAEAPKLDLTCSRQFASWLAEQQLSLAFSTYQAGKLFLVGTQLEGRLSIFERTFNRAMGLWSDSETLYLSTLYQVWRLDNVLAPGQRQDDYDRLFVPQVAWTTGDLDIHDMAVGADGRLMFVNTLFSCLATLSESHSFAPVWRPSFISKLAAEDRCHLNGLTLKDGQPAYATAVSRSDVGDGWRDRRIDGGVVIDVNTDEVIAGGLSMPHSPRWHDDRLWLLDSGSGYLGYVDLKTGRFERVAFCPGYGRGLAIYGRFAVVGLSLPRHNKTFQGLPLDNELAKNDGEARCGLWVVDLESGDAKHWLRIEGVIEELFDVVALPGVQRPMALGLKTDEIRRVISVADQAPLVQPVLH